MKKFIIAILLLSIVTIVLGPVFAETSGDLVKKLQKQVSDKDKIIMEQVKVILKLKENYQPTYGNFDKVKYPATDGFAPDWLKGEHDKILQTCNDAKAMGYENPYCKFVR